MPSTAQPAAWRAGVLKKARNEFRGSLAKELAVETTPTCGLVHGKVTSRGKADVRSRHEITDTDSESISDSVNAVVIS